MKRILTRLSVLAIGLGTMLSFNAIAQTAAPATSKPASPAATQQAPAPQSPTKATASKDTRKEAFTKDLNEMQPKVASLNEKAKKSGSTNPDFAKENNKLNEMVNVFKTKLARWDNAPENQKDAFAETLKKDWNEINIQYHKTETLSKKVDTSVVPQQKLPAAEAAPANK
jgi:hypothetical protein